MTQRTVIEVNSDEWGIIYNALQTYKEELRGYAESFDPTTLPDENLMMSPRYTTHWNELLAVKAA